MIAVIAQLYTQEYKRRLKQFMTAPQQPKGAPECNPLDDMAGLENRPAMTTERLEQLRRFANEKALSIRHAPELFAEIDRLRALLAKKIELIHLSYDTMATTPEVYAACVASRLTSVAYALALSYWRGRFEQTRFTSMQANAIEKAAQAAAEHDKGSFIAQAREILDPPASAEQPKG